MRRSQAEAIVSGIVEEIVSSIIPKEIVSDRAQSAASAAITINNQPQSSVTTITINNQPQSPVTIIAINDNPESDEPSAESHASSITEEDKYKLFLLYFCLKPDDWLRLGANGACDLFWAAVSGLSIDVRGKKTSEFWPATGAEVAYAIPAPLILSIIAVCASEKISPQKAFASFIALAVGLIAWNLGQYYGEQYFSRLGMSDKNAGYASSLCAGSAEGVVQAFLYDAILATLGDQDTKNNYRQFNENPLRAGLFFFSYFVTSSLSGVVWQLIYNAIFPNCTNTPSDCTDPTVKNIVLVGFAVAFGAACTSYLSGAAFNALKQLLYKPSTETESEVASSDNNLRSRLLLPRTFSDASLSTTETLTLN